MAIKGALAILCHLVYKNDYKVNMKRGASVNIKYMFNKFLKKFIKTRGDF